MKLAFELIPDLATRIEPHHWFHLSILQDGAEIPDTRGSDTYLYHAMLLPGQPIAATGRDAVHKPEPDLTGLCGSAGSAVDVPLTDHDALRRITVRLDNNYILSQEVLQSFYALRCQLDAQSILLPLKSHLCRVDWSGLGEFVIDAGALCAALVKPAMEESAHLPCFL